MPTKQQLTFNLRYYDELAYDEIAAITGSTVESAKANYHIAKEKIIKYMNATA
ncbi:MAG TPA: sigma-70 family RNA polymerase sigma factor [Candidatus Avibacteroides excrementipullorum]|nr:sigma-70 family RNA polymerase sigma factor [Candidatus Avibacteroides excrementipullorum]